MYCGQVKSERGALHSSSLFIFSLFLFLSCGSECSVNSHIYGTLFRYRKEDQTEAAKK